MTRPIPIRAKRARAVGSGTDAGSGKGVGSPGVESWNVSSVPLTEDPERLGRLTLN
jgi:hypothetical protein